MPWRSSVANTPCAASADQQHVGRDDGDHQQRAAQPARPAACARRAAPARARRPSCPAARAAAPPMMLDEHRACGAPAAARASTPSLQLVAERAAAAATSAGQASRDVAPELAPERRGRALGELGLEQRAALGQQFAAALLRIDRDAAAPGGCRRRARCAPWSARARWRVMSGSSAAAPPAGALPSSPRRALRSLSWPVRAATNLSACGADAR